MTITTHTVPLEIIESFEAHPAQLAGYERPFWVHHVITARGVTRGYRPEHPEYIANAFHALHLYALPAEGRPAVRQEIGLRSFADARALATLMRAGHVCLETDLGWGAVLSGNDVDYDALNAALAIDAISQPYIFGQEPLSEEELDDLLDAPDERIYLWGGPDLPYNTPADAFSYDPYETVYTHNANDNIGYVATAPLRFTAKQDPIFMNCFYTVGNYSTWAYFDPEIMGERWLAEMAAEVSE